jgi:hypothetical protein
MASTVCLAGVERYVPYLKHIWVSPSKGSWNALAVSKSATGKQIKIVDVEVYDDKGTVM